MTTAGERSTWVKIGDTVGAVCAVGTIGIGAFLIGQQQGARDAKHIYCPTPKDAVQCEMATELDVTLGADVDMTVLVGASLAVGAVVAPRLKSEP